MRDIFVVLQSPTHSCQSLCLDIENETSRKGNEALWRTYIAQCHDLKNFLSPLRVVYEQDTLTNGNKGSLITSSWHVQVTKE